MITLLSLVFGFLSSNVKPLMAYFQDKQDKKHELEVMQLQLQFNKANLDAKLAEIQIEQQSADLVTRYIPSKQSNIAAIINELTKTFIAIALITLYFIVCYIYYRELDAMNDAPFFATHMWTDEDYSLLAVILGYYFGTAVKGSKVS
jgi:hypothetical protein